MNRITSIVLRATTIDTEEAYDAEEVETRVRQALRSEFKAEPMDVDTGCRRRFWNFWRNPHEWGVGECVRCGRKKRCGAQSPGVFLAYYCTMPINHDGPIHRQGDEHRANVTWGRTR